MEAGLKKIVEVEVWADRITGKRERVGDLKNWNSFCKTCT